MNNVFNVTLLCLLNNTSEKKEEFKLIGGGRGGERGFKFKNLK